MYCIVDNRRVRHEKDRPMPLEKRPSENLDHVAVTFRIPAEAAATSVDVVGEFTDWKLVGMQPDDDGGWSAAFDLEVGRAYRFRYLLDGGRWENDWAADNYVPNDFGGDDSVVDVRRSGPFGSSSGTRVGASAYPFV